MEALVAKNPKKFGAFVFSLIIFSESIADALAGWIL
jgi:hypothetical protein